MSKTSFLLPALLAALIATPAWAEPGFAQPGQGQAQARFKQTWADILRKRLGLDEKKASEVEKIMDRFGPERKRLRKAIAEQQRALRELLRNKSDDQASYKRALDTLTDSTTKLNSLRQQEQVELSKVMTPKQQAQLLEIMGRVRRGMRGGHHGKG